MTLNESIVEDAALEWFGELGYAVGHEPHIAPSEPAAKRESFGEVVLVGRLRNAIRLLNPSIPEEARDEALRKVLRVPPSFPPRARPRSTTYLSGFQSPTDFGVGLRREAIRRGLFLAQETVLLIVGASGLENNPTQICA